MTDPTTQQALQELLDRERVAALMDRYVATVDAGGLDADWARSLFSEDVRIEHRGIVLEGPEEVAAGHAFVRDGWAYTYHLSTNHHVDVDGDRAHLTARLMAIHGHRDGQPPEPYFIANVFEADAVRTPAGWRFQSLTLRPVWSQGRSHLDVNRSDTLPQGLRALIEPGPLTYLTTTNADGSPQVTMMWIGFDGDDLVSVHMRENVKLRNIGRHPQVVLAFGPPPVAGDWISPHAIVYATATVERSERAHGVMARLAKTYVGSDAELPGGSEAGYIVRYSVDRVRGIGPWAS